MKKSPRILAALITVAAPITLPAADLYWDINGATAGAGGATPTGNWNTSTANWTTDPLGEIAGTTWMAGDSAIFSAGTDATGTFTVTTTAAQTAASITVEEGIVQHAGTSANTLTTSGLTINDGATFSVAVALTFTPTAGSVLTLNGGTMQNRNGGVGSSFLTSNSANTNMKIVLGTGGGHVQVTGPATAISIYTGLIEGTGPLFIDGTGLFRLTTNVATYSGDTIINGRLQVSTTANVLPAGTGMVINAGGIFDLQANTIVGSLSGVGSVANNIASGTRTLTVGGDASTTFDGVLGTSTQAGVVALTRSGAGTLTLTGLNVQTGTTTVSSGGITVNAGGLLSGATAPLTVNGGTVTLNNAAQSVGKFSGSGGNVNLGSGHTLTITNAGTAGTYSGTISGLGGLVFGGGSEALSGANTYDGITTVNAGILTVGNATALGSTVGNTTVASGAEVLFTGATTNFTVNEAISIAGPGGTDNGAIAVIASASPTISGPITLTADASITVSSSASATFNNAAAITGSDVNLTLRGGNNVAGTKLISGVISLGTGGITKIEGGKWDLAAANTYNGETTISAGTLVAASDSALGTAVGATTVAAAATLGFQGDINYATAEAVSIGGTGVGNAGTINNLSGTNTFAGPITMTANSSIGAAAGSLTLSNVIGESAGPWNLTKVGAGTIILGNTNTYTGTTTVSAGTLVAAANGALGTIDGATTVASAASLGFQGDINYAAAEAVSIGGNGVGSTGAIDNISGTNTFAGPITMTADSSIGASAGSLTLSNAVDGAFNLTKVGTGTLVLSGPQSYETLRVDAGTVTLDSSLPDATITVEDGTLNLNANATDSTLNANGGTVNINVSQTLTALNIGAGGVVTLGPPAFAAASDAITAPDDLFAGAADPVQPVPEPGSFGLLALGALGLLARRRETSAERIGL